MNHEKIEVLFEHNAVGLFGDNGVEGVNLVKRWGEPDEERYSLPIDGFFLAIGHQPNTEIFKEYIDTDEVGYIITDGDSPRTKVPGVFAQEMWPIRIIVKLLQPREVDVRLLWRQNVTFLPKDLCDKYIFGVNE